MSLRCKCGWHGWGNWELYTVEVVTLAPSKYRRTCKRCDTKQYANAVITKVIIDFKKIRQ